MATRKLFQIALKDLRLIFRDRSALLLMLLAPFLLTLGMGAVTGRFSGGDANSGISDIPLVLVNQDGAQLGDGLVEMFTSAELDTLVNPSVLSDPGAARTAVDADEYAAAIIIPAGFTDSIIPAQYAKRSTEVVTIEFYANPTRPTSAGILKVILESFLTQVEIRRISGEISVSQLLAKGIIKPEEAAQVGMQAAEEMTGPFDEGSAIKLVTSTADGEAVEFDILAYMAPGMALMFLMFTVTYGGRSLLVENRQGTLARMLISPTSPALVLGGKALGIFLTAVAQLFILIGGTSLLFRVQWGNPLAVVLLVLAAAFAASGWGVMVAAILKTPGQVASVGSAMMLIFGLLGGSFFDITMLPKWVQTSSKITPNAWGMQGFLNLSRGGGLESVRTPLIALLTMGIVLFIAATFWLNRRGLARK